MPETQIVLIGVLAMVLVTLLGGATVIAFALTKNRIIREQGRALEMEQRLRRTQEAFTDNAHHELRTPLQILTGQLQMLRDLDPRTDQDELLQRALATSIQMEHLVQSLLDLSSLAQGTLTLQCTLTDLEPHLSNLSHRFAARAAAKGLAFQTLLDPLPKVLACDAPRLLQALNALLDNAIGFSEQGTIRFQLKSRSEARTWYLRFEVEDQGPGLPVDWPRLLRPFEQEEQGLRRRRSGLGIGLPLAVGLVESMGGRLGLTPLPHGTLAWVEVSLDEGMTKA